MLVPCLSLSYTLNSPCSSWDAFKEGWQENGLNGVCWRNTYQIWGHAIVGCGFCKAYDSCWGCGSITTCLLSSSPYYSDVEEERKRRAGGKRKELLITCFVWSESPCKYMNSKCRKSNLVAHWYILLFAYLPALIVSSYISGLGTLDTLRYAWIFFLFSTALSISSSISPSFVSFSALSIFSPHLFASFLLHPIPPPHSPFSPHVSLRHQGVFPPRQDAWQGSRWNGEQMTNLSLAISPTVLPEALFGCFLPPSSTFPSYLTTLIFKSAPAAFHLLSSWRSHQTKERGKKFPTLTQQLDIWNWLMLWFVLCRLISMLLT